jgi:hypothetical protein
MSNTIQPNEETQEPEPRETSREEPAAKPAPLRRYSPEEWRRRLKELGVRNATLDPGGPTAFELPGFPDPSISTKSQPNKPAGR